MSTFTHTSKRTETESYFLKAIFPPNMAWVDVHRFVEFSIFLRQLLLSNFCFLIVVYVCLIVVKFCCGLHSLALLTWIKIGYSLKVQGTFKVVRIYISYDTFNNQYMIDIFQILQKFVTTIVIHI